MELKADGIIVHMNALLIILRTLLCLFFLLTLSLIVAPVEAARVADLYAAEVPAPIAVGQTRDRVFKEALQRVLIKITGRRDVAADRAVMNRFSNASALVQQYRTNPDGSVWVVFDRVALRRGLDAVGQPVWGDERPVTLVWLIMDAGMGKRNLLAAEPTLDAAIADPFVEAEVSPLELEREALVRDTLAATARERGLPLLLPIVDSEELSEVSLRDVWGGFNESLERASATYKADAVMIGRARVRDPERIEVRWTLMVGSEQLEWQGDLMSGPDGIADLFAARLSSSLDASGRMTLTVEGVNSLDDYGRLTSYLDKLDVVESFTVDRVDADTVTFTLLVRGDDERLVRSIALRRVLQPADAPLDAPMKDSEFNRDPLDTLTTSLHYQLVTRP